MNKKEILDQEILKSIESVYNFSKAPINRYKKTIDIEDNMEESGTFGTIGPHIS